MTKKIHNIKIVKAEDLPYDIRKKNNVFTGFVELRCEGTPPKTKVIPLDKPPGLRLREEFHKAGIHKI